MTRCAGAAYDRDISVEYNMSKLATGTSSDRLNSLWTEYREVIPDPDVSAEFMPKLWARIEGRRLETASIFRHFSRLCVAVTAALLLLLSNVSVPAVNSDDYSLGTYLELIAADQLNDDVVQAIPIP